MALLLVLAAVLVVVERAKLQFVLAKLLTLSPLISILILAHACSVFVALRPA